MGEKLDNLRNELRVKVNEADKHLKDLEASAKSTNEKTKADVTAQLTSIENKAKEAKSRATAADAKMKAWAEEKKIMTQDKITQWKRERDAKKLASRADRSEDYAIAAMQFAGAAIDEAEKASVEAIVARMDADSIAAPFP